MLNKLNSLLLVAFILATYLLPVGVYANATVPASLIFTEVKVRYDTGSLTDPDEFIEIYNASLVPIQLSGYVIEYFNTTNLTDNLQSNQKYFSDKILAPGGQLVLAKQPSRILNSIPSPYTSLSDTGGRLRIVTSEGDVVDEIAWTNVQSSASVAGAYPAVVYQCNASNVLCTANRAQSFTRQINQEGLYIVDGAIWQLAAISPVSNELLPVLDDPIEDPLEETEEPPIIDDAPTVMPSCEGMKINELLPNADGSDTNNEFIELFNATDEPISLLGCSLQVSSSTKTYQFEDMTVMPGSYIVFSDQLTKLSLPNASGATVWLLDSQKELQAVTYPGDIDDDVSWSFVNGVWQLSYIPTPALANIEQTFKPCEANEQRNQVTKQCEKIISTAIAEIATCKIGQERNTSTNRCRTIVTAASLVACKEGQERNLETNRCRAVNGASTLQACDEGEERNPETNRCRKATTSGVESLAKVVDIASPSSSGGSKLWLGLVAVGLILSYGIYEWRQDISNRIKASLAKFKY